VLTLLGLAARRTTTLDEKMAAGVRDSNLALQAAEAALRDAEKDLKGPLPGGGGGTRIFAVSLFPPSGGADACNTQGLCYVGSDLTQLYNNTAYVSWASGSTSTTQYGAYTGATPITGVAQPPRYVMEIVRFHNGGYSEPNPYSSNPNYFVRVTARGWGASTLTVVTLQALYAVPLP